MAYGNTQKLRLQYLPLSEVFVPTIPMMIRTKKIGKRPDISDPQQTIMASVLKTRARDF